MPRARALLALSLAVACEAAEPVPSAPSRPSRVGDPHGSAVPVDPGEAHETSPALPLDDRTRADHVGRAPRRLDVDQLRASLEEVLGARWVGPRTVHTPEAPSGIRFEPESDLIDFFSAAMGRPNYINTTDEVIEPTIAFAKLAGDAVRSVCAAGVTADLRRPAAERRLLVEVSETDALPAQEAAIRRNIAAVTLRLWGIAITPDGDTATAILGVFRAGSMRAGATPLDGWRVVCVDLATDPRFLSY